jgi:hypothetical protein
VTKTNQNQRDLHDLKVLGAVTRGIGTAATILDATGLGYREVDRALQRLKKAGSIELRGQPRRWVATIPERCVDCGQPMLPPGHAKTPHEYDHASGCPREARS